jgi:hypothetical protein
MGMGERKSKIEERQSGRRDKLAEEHRIAEDEADEIVEWECKDLGMRRESNNESPDLTADQVKQEEGIEEILIFPTLNPKGEMGTSNDPPIRKDSLTTELLTPTSPSTASPLKMVRWSDATPSPTVKVVRHESQLLQPSPQSPPAWGWTKSNLGSKEIEGIESVKENMVNADPAKRNYRNWNSNSQRPDSLGLYDADGFLLSSPEEESVAGA